MSDHRFIVAATLLLVPATGFGDVINGDVADQYVAGPSTSGPQNGTGTTVGNPGGITLKVGSVTGTDIDNANRGRNAVYVFQLPTLGAIASPFTAASLSFGVGVIDAPTTVDADLYGLTRRDATPSIAVTDYYFGNAADTTDATRLQVNILVNPASTTATPTPPTSIVTTDATGSDNLRTFLNTQYDSGTGAGQYVYLRLNVDGSINNVARGYNVYTANDLDPLKRPTITYSTTMPVVGNGDFNGDDIVDGADFLAWQVNMGTASGATLGQGDANDDDDVDGDDLTVWKAQYGTPGPAVQAAPEPAAVALALIAAVGCRTFARRAQSARKSAVCVCFLS